ncbi:hypothetical protein ASPZODRAFT_15985 [Penicilliopsis zonata CBS 506.65]|uniref:Phospholipid/glycerol acyltransferase domain-containing protein n=1 Tax=Penicilliopsis zonata CBS 506.65 TaxID=1073090 RepID=A0A1L9SJH7_9EURO|nr:hypothetical protein ASPZODRAFT_15985 [Penicilliopsis zonata CBS 506.65]OJJ47305.1 hypothetical protein ASPZODRAFT_15985 [Penicilliopsis zonata CBS 506.65]
MSRFSQFRDRGSGIAPFLPIPPEPLGIQFPLRVALFCFRLVFFLVACVSYFAVLQWLPIGSLGNKAALWCILGVPSIWWIDLQIDGVKRGSLAQNKTRLPGKGAVIAASFTSPIDAIYLAAVFDPVFTASYPRTKQVEHLSLFQAVVRAFAPPRVTPPPSTKLVDIDTLLRRYPSRPLVLFPECTTTNGRGVLPLSPSVVGVPPATRLFPVSLRYTPVDVVTPLPGSYLSFLWTLLSKPTHCIRVRIAESITVPGSSGSGNVLADDGLTPPEKALLDSVGESLARLGRVKRVGLGVQEKVDFVRLWSRTRRTW